MFDPRQYEREMRAAQRKAEAQYKREVDAYNRKVQQHNQKVEREHKRTVDDYNRQVDRHNKRVEQQERKAVEDWNRNADRHNKKVVDAYNREVRQVNAHNEAVIADLNSQLRAASSGPRYTVQEQVLADRVQQAIAQTEDREWDTFLSHARIDGAETGEALRQQLEALGVTVWFDAIAIAPGKSQALQMDKGLQAARAGIALLTPAYLAGRFWTERELGALLGKETLIPVLHGVTFEEVKEYSGILPDLAGFETSRDSVEVIAGKIAAAVLGE